MAELIQQNWVFFLIALAIGILVAWWVFSASRRTRIEIDPGKPVEGAPPKRNQALIDSPPVASPPAAKAPPPAPVAETVSVTPVVQPVAAPSPAQAPAPSPTAVGGGDDLTRIKGVGPKLAAQLREMGVTAYAQIAAWDDAEIDRVDAQLGRFQGRIRRDNWPEQASLLAAGDVAGFEGKFGKT